MKERKGIVLAGGSGSRLYPLTLAVSKQLMPVYDKPMIYYPLSVLMLSGIREILLISTPHDLPAFKKLLGNGSRFGIKLKYAEQPSPDGLAQALIIAEDFLAGHPSALVLGDNLFYGTELPARLTCANDRESGASIFGYHVSNPSDYGIAEFNKSGKVISLEEKPEHPKSKYAIPGLYFYDERASAFANALKPSARGELEITDLNQCYLDEGSLHVELLGRGTAWLDTGTHDSLLEAGEFIALIAKRQGLMIACLEEIAFERGWLSSDDLKTSIEKMGKSEYGSYLSRLIT